MATTEFIAAIELSSSKISGIAGKKNSDGSAQVLAYADADASLFVRKGIVYNIDKASQALTSIIGKLEAQLNSSIAQVYVGISGQSLRTLPNEVSRELNEESIITQELVDSICDENREVKLLDMNVLDVAPQEYKIDNIYQADPVGVAGKNITGNFLNIVARASLKKNLELSFEQAKMKIADLMISPIALANAVLSDNEMRSGCALVDIGADTTTVMVFKNNILRFISVLPLGSNNITRDLTTLMIEEHEAEHLKLEYGDLLYDEEDNEEATTCTLEDGRKLEIAALNNIIECRAEEIIVNVLNQLQLSEYEGKLLSGIVLTGGGANLKNIEEAFRKLSKDKRVKIARFVKSSIYGFDKELKKDGTHNTLLGILMAGTDNCCQKEVKQEAASKAEAHTIQDIFENDEDMKRQKAEAMAAKAERERQEEIRRQKEREENIKKKKEREKQEANKKDRLGWFGKKFNDFKDNLLSDE